MKKTILFCCVILSFLAGCDTDKRNPVGGAFIDRDAGQTFSLPSIPLRTGQSFQALVFPTRLGDQEDLLVGQMNKFALRSLLRFKIPIDQLAADAGGVSADLTVDSLRIQVGIRSTRLVDNASLSVLHPQTDWDELQIFVDSLTLIEKEILASPIVGANAHVLQDRVLIDLPGSFLTDLRVAEADSPTVDILLEPNGSAEFLLDLIARENAIINPGVLIPQLEMVYRVGDLVERTSIAPRADTYWNTRVEGGPSRDLILLSEGMFYGTTLDFDIPTQIPPGATINSAKLEFDVDHDRSFYSAFPFEIYHMEFTGSPQDTVFTRYNTPLLAEPTIASYTFNQSLVQAWMSGAQVNQGLALSPLNRTSSTGLFTLLNSSPKPRWIVLNDVRLNIVYSLPPEL